MHPYITNLLSHILAYAPTSYIHSWLLYLGIQAALPDATQEFAPLRNYCEFLNALHVYADEARRGVVRSVEASHFCSHVSKGMNYEVTLFSMRIQGVHLKLID
jgi:Protein of unknown function (DUF1264)